jgi:hypothetical protein
MFVLSVKTNVKQIAAVCGCVAVVALATVLAVILPARNTVAVSGTRVGDSAERIAYLQSLGYTVTAKSEEVQEIRIPEQPDATVSQYNALQQTAGRSLEPYYGKRVRLYTYDVENDRTGGVAQVHLYVYRDRVVAGDVTSDGVMKPIG